MSFCLLIILIVCDSNWTIDAVEYCLWIYRNGQNALKTVTDWLPMLCSQLCQYTISFTIGVSDGTFLCENCAQVLNKLLALLHGTVCFKQFFNLWLCFVRLLVRDMQYEKLSVLRFLYRPSNSQSVQTCYALEVKPLLVWFHLTVNSQFWIMELKYFIPNFSILNSMLVSCTLILSWQLHGCTLQLYNLLLFSVHLEPVDSRCSAVRIGFKWCSYAYGIIQVLTVNTFSIK